MTTVIAAASADNARYPVGQLPAGRQQRARQWLWRVAAVVPVVVYFAVVVSKMANVPYMDDYYDILLTFVFMGESTSLAGYLQGLFWQFHQHLVVYDRLVYWLYSLCTDTIDIRIFILVGNLGLLAYCVALCCRVPLSQQFLLPCLTAIVFSLYHEEQTFWAMAAVQQFTIMVFTVLALMWLDAPNKRLLVAGAMAALALFTQSNEALILPLGFCILLDDYWRHRSRAALVTLVSWAAISVVILIPFLLLNRMNAKPSLMEGAVVLQGFEAFTAIINNFLASLVSLPFTVGDPVNIQALVGAGHAVLILYLMARGWRHDRVIVCLMAFCLLSLLAASIMRTPFYGPTAYVSRYKIFCTSIICGEMILASRIFSQRFALRYLFLLIALAINLHSYDKNLDYAQHTQDFRSRKYIEWLYTGFMQDFPFSAELLGQTYDNGTFRPLPDLPVPVMPAHIEEVAACPDMSGWQASTAIVAQSVTYSRAVMLSAVGKANWHTVPEVIWLCGQRHFRVVPQQPIPDDVLINRNERWLVLLEKTRFAGASYRIGIVQGGIGQQLQQVVDMRLDTSQLPADCSKYRKELPVLMPSLYHRYCPLE